jgi:probable F420-dependent oxidoreductase
MRFGAKLPDFGPKVFEFPLAEAARRAEAAEFDSVWVSDHVVMVRDITSPYPYSKDGVITWDPEAARFDAIISMTTAAAATERVEVGVAVLIAAMRNPLVLAKQLATLDVVSGGRVVVGVGAGWLREEFDALGVEFEKRGARLNEWISILRECWKGEPSARDFEQYPLPEGLYCYPTPLRKIPILVGGMSRHALRRAGALGDGWLAFQRAETVDVAALEAGMSQCRADADAAGRTAPLRTTVRITGALDEVIRHLPALESIGVTDVVVEADWATEDGPRQTLETLRDAVA